MFGAGNVRAVAGRWPLLVSLIALAAFSGCEDTQKVRSPKDSGNPADPAIGTVTFDSALLWGTTVSGTIAVTGEPGAILSWTLDNPSAAGSFAMDSDTVTLDADGAGTIAVSYTAPDTTGSYTYGLTVEGEDATGTADLQLAVTRAGVAMFDDPTYFNDNPVDPYAGASNMFASLDGMAYSVSKFTDESPANFRAALLGKAAMVVPTGGYSLDYSAPFNSTAIAELESFVAKGGLLVVSCDTIGDWQFLNAVFGFSITGLYSYTASSAPVILTAANGTPFAGGPATLADNFWTYTANLALLPPESISLYVDSNGHSALTLIPHGNGNILFVAYNWGNAMPIGTQDGGWLQVLDTAIGAAEDGSF